MAADTPSKDEGNGAPPPKDPRSYTATEHSDSQAHSEDHDEQGKGKDDKSKPPAKPRKGLFQRPITLIVLAVVILALIIGGVLYWLHARQFQSTDDAFVDTHLVRLAPQISGRVLKVLVEDNQRVEA